VDSHRHSALEAYSTDQPMKSGVFGPDAAGKAKKNLFHNVTCLGAEKVPAWAPPPYECQKQAGTCCSQARADGRPETSGSQGASQENLYECCVHSSLCPHRGISSEAGNRPEKNKTHSVASFHGSFLNVQKHTHTSLFIQPGVVMVTASQYYVVP